MARVPTGQGVRRYKGPFDAAYDCVYFMADADRNVLYVGSSQDLTARIGGHCQQSTWWPEVAAIWYRCYPNRAAATEAELKYIHKLRPPKNVTGMSLPRGRPKGVGERQPRSRKGDGSVRERTPGVWQVRLSVGGRVLTRTVHGTRADASMVLAKLRVDADKILAQPAEAARANVSDLIDAWWVSPTVAAAGSTKAENTLSAASAAIRNWIRPYLGHIMLAKLNARDIERMVAAMQAKGLKPSSIQRYVATLNTMLEQAVDWGWLDANPRRKAKLTPARHKQIDPPSTLAVQLILRRVDDGWHGPHADTLPALVWLLAHSGIRKGEACGLQWGDVNWTAGHIVVQRNVSQSARSGVVVGPTKNKRPRIVTLEPSMMDRLNALYQQRLAEGPVEKDRWVFGRDGGRKVLTPNALAAAYADLPKAAGVTLNLHGFRHWHATHLLDLGIPVRTVQERLGHSAASITLNTYAHPVDSTARLASQRIAGLVEELTATESASSARPRQLATGDPDGDVA